MFRRPTPVLSAILLLSWLSPAVAQGPVARPSEIVAARPAPTITLDYGADGRLWVANSSVDNPGRLDSGVALDAPGRDSHRPFETTRIRVSPTQEVHLITVEAKGGKPRYQALVAHVSGEPKPRVIFQGETGWVRGEEGMRRGAVIELSEPIDATGVRRVVVGEQQEDLQLCGRPAVLAPQLLTPEKLELRPAKVQRLSVEERARAPRLTATLVEPTPAVAAPGATGGDAATVPSATGGDAAPAPLAPPSASLLRAVGATSAIGWPSALTDGDPETTWSENRGGAGRGEFVLMRAPSDVPLSSFQLRVRPEKRAVPHGVGAQQLWLATRHQVYSVSFAEDPWKRPGARYKIALPAPVRTDCVALVTDSAFDERPDAAVTFAEFSAESEFVSASLENLVGALAGGGERAETAGSVLASLGEPGQRAAIDAFDKLDEGGRRVVLNLLDTAPCERMVPTFLRALLGTSEGQRIHVLERLPRCAVQVREESLKLAAELSPTELARLGDAIATFAPAAALELVGPRLRGNAAERRALRDVIARATRDERGDAVVEQLLADPKLDFGVATELLRALGARAQQHAASAGALLERIVGQADFRRRFLLVAPSHQIADKHPFARQWLATAITRDPNPHIRAEAARSTRQPALFSAELLHALSDSEVRVREAAVNALGQPGGDFAAATLGERLDSDPWPLVREAAATTLGTFRSNPELDARLVKALSDESLPVRVRAVEALVKRKASATAAVLLEHFEDSDEALEVRIAAARALGLLCYAPAGDALAKQARRLTDAGLESLDRALAGASMASLGRIHPADLPKLLQPLVQGEGTPAPVRAAAKALLAGSGACAGAAH